jgi:hypothetical protein
LRCHAKGLHIMRIMMHDGQACKQRPQQGPNPLYTTQPQCNLQAA